MLYARTRFAAFCSDMRCYVYSAVSLPWQIKRIFFISRCLPDIIDCYRRALSANLESLFCFLQDFLMLSQQIHYDILWHRTDTHIYRNFYNAHLIRCVNSSNIKLLPFIDIFCFPCFFLRARKPTRFICYAIVPLILKIHVLLRSLLLFFF